MSALLTLQTPASQMGVVWVFIAGEYLRGQHVFGWRIADDLTAFAYSKGDSDAGMGRNLPELRQN